MYRRRPRRRIKRELTFDDQVLVSRKRRHKILILNTIVFKKQLYIFLIVSRFVEIIIKNLTILLDIISELWPLEKRKIHELT